MVPPPFDPLLMQTNMLQREMARVYAMHDSRMVQLNVAYIPVAYIPKAS